MSAPEPPGPGTPEPQPPSQQAAAGQPQAPLPRTKQPSDWQPALYLKIGLLLLAIGYSIAFVVENSKQIKIHFVFATAKVHLIWEILLLLAVGLVGGVLISQLYRHRRASKLAKKGRKPRDSGSNVRN